MDVQHTPGQQVAPPDDATDQARTLASRLAHAFATSLATDVSGTDDLRRAAERYTAHLRSAGLPPERAVIAVKHALALTVPPLTTRQTELVALREQVVRWCIVAYFRDD